MRKELSKFLEYLRSIRNCSKHTVRNYAVDLQLFFNFLEEISIQSVERTTIRHFIVSQREGGKSKRTIARRLSSLRAFFRFCMREKMLSQNPMQDVEGPKLDRPIPHPLTYAQVEQFLGLPDTSTYLGHRDRAMMELFYSSGLRVSELAGLNRSDVDKDELLLRVLGKGNKERIIPVTQRALEWLFSYLNHAERCQTTKEHGAEKDEKAVFLNRLGMRLTTRSIDRLFSRYYKMSGFVDTITPHVIRHTIATHWLEQGMDLKTIQMLLGHNSMATTTIYTEVSPDLKKKVIAKYHPKG